MKQPKALKRDQKVAIDRFGENWKKYGFLRMDETYPDVMILFNKETKREEKIPLKGGMPDELR